MRSNARMHRMADLDRVSSQRGPSVAWLVAAVIAILMLVPIEAEGSTAPRWLASERGLSSLQFERWNFVSTMHSAVLARVETVALALRLHRVPASAHAEGAAGPCHGLRGVGFAFLGLTALVLIALGRMRHIAELRKLEIARKLVEQGFVVPADLIASTARIDLRRGLVLVFTGVGLLAAAAVSGDPALGPMGLIPAFIGVGYLVSYRVAMRREPS